jgi:hypothetical protein
MFCAECGKTIPEGGRFCHECGRPVGVEAAAPPPPPVPPYPPAYSPPPVPPRRSHAGLIPGIVTAVIIVAAGLGVGLFFGLKGDDTLPATTTAPTVAASITTAPPTTTTTAAPSTTTSLVTTTSEQTTTTENATAILTQRAAVWMDLLESIPATGKDVTAQIAALLTPKDQAQARAAQYQTDWATPGDPQDIIKTDAWDQIAEVVLEPDGSRAITVATLKLACRDGLTTRGLEALTWRNDNGEWLRTISYEPLDPAEGQMVPLGRSMRAGDLFWSPDVIHELKHLGVGEGPTAKGMFMTVEFYVRNDGPNDVHPVGWQVFAVDGSGKVYGLSSIADEYWYNDLEARDVPLLPGESTWLWYTFEVPEGLDLQSVQFQVMLPGI